VPKLKDLLNSNTTGKPVAIVLAGHNGSGKSTLWHDRLAASWPPWLFLVATRRIDNSAVVSPTKRRTA
jgi:hypothetical protein